MGLGEGLVLHDPRADVDPLRQTYFTGQSEMNPNEHAGKGVFLGGIGNAVERARLNLGKRD